MKVLIYFLLLITSVYSRKRSEPDDIGDHTHHLIFQAYDRGEPTDVIDAEILFHNEILDGWTNMRKTNFYVYNYSTD